MAEDKGMSQEEVDVRAQGEADMAPEERAQTFADAVTGMVAKVASGDITLDEFVDSVKAELETVTPEPELGGLGGNSSDFNMGDQAEEDMEA